MHKKIMIVEDNKVHRQLLVKILGEFEYELYECCSGEECIESLEKNKVDLILLDILMPGLSGVEVLEKIRKIYNPVELPIIMVTSRDEEADVVGAFKFGANDYITKPINVGILKARVETQLSRSDYYRESLRLKELEALKALIVTLNHELNGSLSIISIDVNNEAKKNEKFQRTKNAVEKITHTLKKIQQATSTEVKYTEYASKQNMIDIKK